MYAFSRAIYRELADAILEAPFPCGRYANHEHVLRACEAAIDRLASDRLYFARPTRALFSDIRAYFPMSAQLRFCALSSTTSTSLTSTCASCRRTASTRTAIRCNVARAPGRARCANGCLCLATATAHRISTSPRPRTTARDSSRSHGRFL
jgi:hypothetical protein